MALFRIHGDYLTKVRLVKTFDRLSVSTAFTTTIDIQISNFSGVRQANPILDNCQIIYAFSLQKLLLFQKK
jgi:hypothetical protein